MAIIREIRGFRPTFGDNCWLAETAVVLGEVELGEDCTVWYNAVVRGDVNYIRVGDRTNIQDNVTIHGTYEKAPTNIGNDVSIGHNAVIHGCTIEDEVLIGIGAIVLDGAVVKTGAIVAAGAVVLAGTVVEGGWIYGGIPAKKLKPVEGKNREMQSRIAKNYIKYAGWFKNDSK
ncbi:MAG: gamma carbonic anhydrase family protein [Cyclobacteriaceae bacterium]